MCVCMCVLVECCLEGITRKPAIVRTGEVEEKEEDLYVSVIWTLFGMKKEAHLQAPWISENQWILERQPAGPSQEDMRQVDVAACRVKA